MAKWQQWVGCLVVAWGAILAVPVHAQENAKYPYVERLWHGIYDVEPDGKVTETVTVRLEPLQESAIDELKLYRIGYSASIQVAEVLEAYTLKKDGRKVPAPPGNYQKQVNEGRDGAVPMFSDQSQISVVFPELAVGDIAHLVYRRTDKAPMFPGHYSMALSLSPFRPYDETRITLRVPLQMALKSEVYRFEAAPGQEVAGKRVFEWRHALSEPKPYVPEEDAGIWQTGETPTILVSTFDSYEALARAYGDRALPKAQPTERIRALARAIAGQEVQPREKARLLYEWVSRSISYGGNCIGVGAVVPRDTDLVLDNKMGDCKDHATLLQALLAAQGIASEQVLINAYERYDLPETPVVSTVNHVMNFLPEWNLYVDATAKEIPFGLLPPSAYAKPVIHIGRAIARAQIPDDEHARTEQRTHTSLRLMPDGSASGTMHVALRGREAAGIRAFFRDASVESERNMVRQALSAYGYKGRGIFVKGDTSGLSDRYEYTAHFEIDQFLQGGLTGAFYLSAVIGAPLGIERLANAAKGNLPLRSVTCRGFHSYDTYELELPPGFEVLALPPDAEIAASVIDYSASYVKSASAIRFDREVHDKTMTSICSPEKSAEFIRQAAPVADNLNTQVVYRRVAR